MRIDTRSAAENAATISVPNEVTCGRSVSTQRRLPLRFRADRRTGDEADPARRSNGVRRTSAGERFMGSTIAGAQSSHIPVIRVFAQTI